MADFCKQCSIDLFDRDFGDMQGIITEEDDKSGIGASVICEGCGLIQVNSKGECVMCDLKPNQSGHGPAGFI